MVDTTAIESQLNSERRRVDVDSNNFPVRELVRMMAEGELDIAPAYQRKFRWPEHVESALIESVFLGLPVPTLFVATNEGFQWEVVDGLQRLSTLLPFISDDAAQLALIGKDRPLELSGLEKLGGLNGLAYANLPRPLQIHFSRQPLQVTALTDKSDSQVRFDLFERLNRGAIVLSPQEVRACVFKGEFNDFLDRLADYANFKGLLKLQPAKQNDGTAAETVLKFFAYSEGRDRFTGKVTTFLNKFSESVPDDFDYEANELLFKRVVDELARILNGQPYVRSDYNVTPLVQLEASLVALGDLISSNRAIGTPDRTWVDDEELKAASMGGSNTNSALKRRIARAHQLLEAK